VGAFQRGSLAEARTAALNLFVVVEAFYLFSCRSLTRSAWRSGLFSNRWVILGVSVQVVGQLAITYLPAMNAVFGTTPSAPKSGCGFWSSPSLPASWWRSTSGCGGAHDPADRLPSGGRGRYEDTPCAPCRGGCWRHR
jgi:magnesium-transporting ATPase (P-type)